MSKTVFTATEDEKLLEEVGRNRVLYDSSLDKHKNVNFKDDIWKNISIIVGKTSMLSIQFSTSDFFKILKYIIIVYIIIK